jgi:para-aminobenzoate synthetase component 2
MILVIDNYDSFTYNLVQYLGELGADLPVAREIEVARNDRITIEEIEGLAPERIVLSPGPCTPDEAGITLDVIRHFAGKVPLLGVCLGHQAMGQAFGGSVVRAPYLMHGKTSQILHDGRTVFQGVENPFTATRYHSLIVDRASLPSALEVSATTSDGLVMGLRHREFICEGVQFHPESIMTASGRRLLANYLKL